MAARRWLADEMLGRLARYLRFLGEDVAYAKGLDDTAIAAWARRDGRILITRDRRLAAQVDGSVLLDRVDVLEQLGALYGRFPELPKRTRSTRCTACNGELEIADEPAPPGPRSPPPVRYRCRSCGQRFWEGSHAALLDARLAAR